MPINNLLVFTVILLCVIVLDSSWYLMAVNTILLILLVIINYTNFYFTHIHGRVNRRNSYGKSSPRF